MACRNSTGVARMGVRFSAVALPHPRKSVSMNASSRALHFEKYALTRSSNCSPVILAPQVLGIFTSRFTSS